MEGGGAAAPSKKRQRDATPDTAAALLAGRTLPRGTYYCSLVVSRQPSLVSSLLACRGSIAPPCFTAASPHTRVQQESALWLFIGRNAHSSASLAGRPMHTDAVDHSGTFHCQLAGRKEWRLRPTEELCAALVHGRPRAQRATPVGADEAHEQLSKPDVTVTNLSDKEDQLVKVKQLDGEVQAAWFQ